MIYIIIFVYTSFTFLTHEYHRNSKNIIKCCHFSHQRGLLGTPLGSSLSLILGQVLKLVVNYAELNNKFS